MPTVENWTLWLHVAAGAIALLSGLGALGSVKGSARHQLAGRLYVLSMAVVIGTVMILLILDRTDAGRQVLFLIAVFSGYFVFSGYRVVSRRRSASLPGQVDELLAWLLLIVSLGLGAVGLSLGVSGSSFGFVLIIFGAIGLVTGVSDLRVFRNGGPEGPWIADHLGRMIAGYIATVTAVSVVNLTGLAPTVVVWLWPTALGVPLIWYWEWKFTNTGPIARMAS